MIDLDLWVKVPVAAIIAVALVALLARKVKPDRFRRLTWKAFAGASMLFWGLLAAAAFWIFWETYYRYFYPRWMRWLVPLSALTYAAIGLALRWLAARLPGNPVVNFCLLGGLESVPEHVWGIYGAKILEVPILQGITPVFALLFAVFEYVIYWSVVLILAVLLGRCGRDPGAPAQ
jgi:hypothetical protein